MDAFIAAVDEAKLRYARETGTVLSDRQLITLAKYSPGERAGAAYHLNRRKVWPKGHDVPPELVERLANVLPISHEELARAAQVARGYNLRVPGADLPTAYARFLGDGDIEPDEKAQVTAKLLKIIADETAGRTSPAKARRPSGTR